jgi:hypothetical protein
MNNKQYFDETILEDFDSSEYSAFPPTSELHTLKDEVATYHRPEYETVEYIETRLVYVNYFKLRKNVGRFKGNDQKVYDTVAKSLEKGYKRNCLPPIVLEKEDGKLEDWLVNGNHRYQWYKNNNFAMMIVDVYRIKPGVHEEDVMDEVGLLHQPQPTGTSSCYEDYKARGIAWVERQINVGNTITQEGVDAWVDKFAINESSATRANLKRVIFDNTEKQSWLINFTRAEARKFFSDYGFNITDQDKKVRYSVVDRLFEASQRVSTIRGFLPNFLRDAAAGTKTRLHFYVNTSNVKDGSALIDAIEDRIDEIEDVLKSLETFNEANSGLRDYLEYGYRPPQIIDVDRKDSLVAIK